MNQTPDAALSTLARHFPSDTPPAVRTFAEALFGHTPSEELAQRDPVDLCRAASSHWELFRQRGAAESKVRIYSPELERGGWRFAHSVVEIVTDDMPFLVDSIRMALNRHGLTVHLIAHSVIRVVRDDAGRVLELTSEADNAAAESIMYIEVNRRTDTATLRGLQKDILSVLDDVRAAVADWPRMRAKIHEILAELARHPPPIEPTELEEGKAFLEWVEDNHFTFLGYRFYELSQEEGEDVLRMVPGSALGTAPTAAAPTPSQTFSSLSPEQRAEFRSPNLLVLTKANVRATVHRPVYMDYIGVKRFDAGGQVVGEHRFLGLYASAAYHLNTRDIPLLRRKVNAVFERSGMSPVSHNGKALLNILETYPRDELLQISTDELYDNAIGILNLQERQLVRLFVRREDFGRFVSCIVFVPRERYDTVSRECIQSVLLESFGGESADFTVHLSESVLARAYFIIHTPPGSVFEHDHAALESRIAACARTWQDELQSILVEGLGEEAGNTLFRRYRDAFPSAYRDDFDPRAAVRDIEDIEELPESGWQVLALYRPLGAEPGQFRFKLFSGGHALALSDILPVLENMGVRVIRERPYQIRPANSSALWIYDFSLQYDSEEGLDLDAVKERFQAVVSDVWRGEAESDGFNRLVLRAQLDCREITVLRAYGKFLRQTGIAFSQPYMEQALANNGAVARLLIELFHARFDVEQREHSASRASRAMAELQEALDAVVSLDDDRILRSFFSAVQATLRTNFYQTDPDGRPKPYLSLKLEPKLLPELPAPRPAFEIFVYSPRTEGVHLRGGKVARGGIRWSDRREDFRTEILGLMKAQMVKNAIIVPVGAKGGFVVKRPPASADRTALMNEVVSCYRTFIRGLLDLTDNLQGDATVPPPSVLRHDGDDPYLVVAADKGTATFSDIANELSKEYRFWLGDAFASGGSTGYDHKKMGITARGAWVSVQRHFRELGLDVQREPFTVVGIGDMSGDVFGNGMLRSRQIKLLAAFDHRHIFIDPDPDPETSHRERERLFALPRSSWADYDASLISTGGGVYPRSAKSIRLSAEARQALGLNAESLPPEHLVRALLKAPVDLLWNGGIGTYVKASRESHTDVGDRSNDAVRVNGKDLRCRVVGEGGNLGITQRGRIEYALSGGRINTDFIDNAGGVSCSDYEVNIKILLNAVVASGGLAEIERNELLASMTEEVASLVLTEGYWQTWAISFMESRARMDLDEHVQFIRALERTGLLDRALESLPDDEELAERRAAETGLTRPELAVLITYAKNAIYQGLLASDASEDPFLSHELARYFPLPLRERFPEAIERHPLRRELISTYVTNRMVNRLGATFASRMQDEHGADIAQVTRAYLAAWSIFDLAEIANAVAALDNRIPAQAQLRMLHCVGDLVRRGTSWLLRHGPVDQGVTGLIDRYQPGARHITKVLASLLSPEQLDSVETEAQEIVGEEAPADLARRALLLDWLYTAFDVVELTHLTAAPIDSATEVYFGLDAALDLDWLRERIAQLPADDHWHARARDALTEDLYARERRLVEDILMGGDRDADPDSLLTAWTRKRHHAIERYKTMAADLGRASALDMPMLSVAVREIGGMMAAPR